MKTLLLLFFSFSLMAAPKKYLPIKDLPYELALLIESTQDLIKEEKEKEMFLAKLKNLDSYLSSLTKEEAFFVSKSEIYFDILRRNRSSAQIETELLTERTLENFDKLLTRNKEKYTKYTYWLGQAIKRDLERLFSTTQFSLFVSRLKNGRISSSKDKVLHKKIKMLLPWYQKYADNSPEELEKEMKNIFLGQISALTETFSDLVYFSRFDKKAKEMGKDYKLKFFELKEEEKVPEKNLTDVDIIENIDVPENKPVQKAEAWVPQEGPPTDLFPEPDPSYTAPNKLPEPVDDWVLEM